MNWKRGLLRVWLLLSAVWLVGILGWLWSSRLYGLRDIQTGQVLNMIAFRTRPWESGWIEPNQFTALDFTSLALMMFGVPLLVLFVAWCGRWVSAGFRP